MRPAGLLRAVTSSTKAGRRPATRAAAAALSSPKTHSGPSTRLPFLQNIVRSVVKQPRTTDLSPPFRPYPVSSGTSAARPSSTASTTPLYLDERCVLVRDAYPKSTVHCLVMPLDLDLVSLASLEARHAPLLRHMVSVANDYAQFLKRDDPKQFGRLRFITGFHALPSLPMLHLHLISMDLDSPCLKTKKHYNSFARSSS